MWPYSEWFGARAGNASLFIAARNVAGRDNTMILYSAICADKDDSPIGISRRLYVKTVDLHRV
jgi:hypothetical protein